jgi:hypothetical protein
MFTQSSKKTKQGVCRAQVVPSGLESWQKGARALAEQGRIAWLVGEGLRGALASQASGAIDIDQEAIAAHLWDWVKRSVDAVEGIRLDGFVTPTLKSLPAVSKKGLSEDTAPHQARSISAAPRKSKSDSRRGVVEKVSNSPLSGACPVLWIGSHQVRGAWVSMALGVDVNGKKSLLSLKSGAVRDVKAADAIVADLVGRGLVAAEGMLVITDGSRSLDGSIARAWSGRALVGHCQIQLLHDVLAHVPEVEQPALRAELQAAWAQPAEMTLRSLEDLVVRLSRTCPGAAERLERSVKASVVVTGLGIPSPLKEHLQSAGTLRMAFEKTVSWGGSKEVGLWAVAAGVPIWLRRTRRMMGWAGLSSLAEALRAHVAGTEPA